MRDIDRSTGCPFEAAMVPIAPVIAPLPRTYTYAREHTNDLHGALDDLSTSASDEPIRFLPDSFCISLALR